VAGRPGGRGESQLGPAPPLSRVNGSPWVRGTQGSWRAAVRRGEDEPRACAHLPGSAMGAARRAVSHSQPSEQISSPFQ
jgi:hypothetical protein